MARARSRPFPMRQRPAAHPLVVVALILLVTAPALAQGQNQVPVLVENVTPLRATVAEDEAATFTFSLVNLNREKGFFVSVVTDRFEEWTVLVEPNRFILDAGATRNVTVSLIPPADTPPLSTTGVIEVNLVDTDTGAVTTIPHEVRVFVERDPLVLGVFENPLPAPLDNAYGVFALDMLFWAAVGLIAYLTGDTIVRRLTRYARRDVTRIILAKLRWPIFVFVLLIGVRESFGVLPRNAITETIHRFLTVIVVGVVGIYLLWRVIDATIFYYEKEVAPRTRTKLDDILVPFLRKVALVAVFFVAIGYFLKMAGLNIGVLFGAAGVLGIVIGLAAQESLSNFFGGLFILLDRPFLEGDDIQLETGEITRVEHIGLRSTKLYHYRDHDMIILPNNQLASRRVVNLTYPDPRFKLNIDVGVAYGSDIEKVKRSLFEALEGDPNVVREPDDEPLYRFSAFGDNALLFTLRFGVKDFRERFQVASDVRERIDAIFRREGIEIPFPQRTMWMREMPRMEVEATVEQGDASGGRAQ